MAAIDVADDVSIGLEHNVFRASRSVHFACGNHRGHATMHVAVDPSQLILTGSPVARDRMYMAVDESWTESSSARVDDRRGVSDVNVFFPPYRNYPAVNCNHGIGIEDRPFEIAT